MKYTQAGKGEVPNDLILAVSVDETAIMLGVSRSTVYVIMGDGLLPYFKIGRRRLIYRKDLDEFIRKQRRSMKEDDTAKPSSDPNQDGGAAPPEHCADGQNQPENNKKLNAGTALTPPSAPSISGFWGGRGRVKSGQWSELSKERRICMDGWNGDGGEAARLGRQA